VEDASMSVAITDPPANEYFPYDEGWAATATIDFDDAVDGVLIDYNTNDVYPSPGPSCSGGPDSSGLYTWQVPFNHDANIVEGDPLLIYCYDAEIDGDGASVPETASQDGRKPASEPGRREPKSPREGAPSITITDAHLSGTTVSVTATLTPQTKGGIFLVLANFKGDIRKFTRLIRVCSLPADASAKRSCTFSDVDGSKWTHIHVIAVTYRNQGKPQIRTIKKPSKKREPESD
jgi:hypothetical protein